MFFSVTKIYTNFKNQMESKMKKIIVSTLSILILTVLVVISCNREGSTEEILNPKIENLLKNKDFNQDEFTYLSEQVKYKLIENKKSWVYNLSDKQRELLENKDHNVDDKVLSIIKDKSEFNTKEWAIIQRTIKDIFSKPKEFKNKDFNR